MSVQTLKGPTGQTTALPSSTGGTIVLIEDREETMVMRLIDRILEEFPHAEFLSPAQAPDGCWIAYGRIESSNAYR